MHPPVKNNTEPYIYPAKLLLMFLHIFGSFDYNNFMITYNSSLSIHKDFLIQLPRYLQSNDLMIV